MHLTLKSLSKNSREKWINTEWKKKKNTEWERYHSAGGGGGWWAGLFCFLLLVLRERKLNQREQEWCKWYAVTWPLISTLATGDVVPRQVPSRVAGLALVSLLGVSHPTRWDSPTPGISTPVFPNSCGLWTNCAVRSQGKWLAVLDLPSGHERWRRWKRCT